MGKLVSEVGLQHIEAIFRKSLQVPTVQEPCSNKPENIG